MLVILTNIWNVLVAQRESLTKTAVKMFPILAIPIFLLSATIGILTNDAMYGHATNALTTLQSGGSSGKSGFMEIYAKMNYFWPIGETVVMLATLIPLKLSCLVIRIAKSWIPTVN